MTYPPDLPGPTPAGDEGISRGVTVGAVPPWPALPDELAALLADIAAEEEDQPPYPRPWELGSLPEDLREPTWAWLHAAVTWINSCYGWKAETVIPACWPQHPHLALDLAVLAFTRELAARMTIPRDLRYWHSDLYTFHAQMRGDGRHRPQGLPTRPARTTTRRVRAAGLRQGPLTFAGR